ncbi:uncharacterized protein SCHCODRAFT_01098235 [Schizophyllum commune H4-8]|nr:uncharacterized protein SCHCODRAFT_01098235 [Schizophyllum commune H4-8]KAI5890841.1 hypothetical protein SCHCODRAFT_01098235 [Schizophyllum commune H4-8]
MRAPRRRTRAARNPNASRACLLTPRPAPPPPPHARARSHAPSLCRCSLYDAPRAALNRGIERLRVGKCQIASSTSLKSPPRSPSSCAFPAIAGNVRALVGCAGVDQGPRRHANRPPACSLLKRAACRTGRACKSHPARARKHRVRALRGARRQGMLPEHLRRALRAWAGAARARMGGVAVPRACARLLTPGSDRTHVDAHALGRSRALVVQLML